MIKLHPQVKALWEREGCEPLRYDYDLNPDSLVLDIGGSIGNFAHGIVERYNCNVRIYEPLQTCYDACVIRFAGNKKVKVFHAAVVDKSVNVYMDQFEERVIDKRLAQEGHYEMAEGIDIWDLVKRPVDLMKINIEGGEYPLLERLVNCNIKNVDNIQVQFHMLEHGDSLQRRHRIQNLLSATHELAWCYEFVWESWRIKKW